MGNEIGTPAAGGQPRPAGPPGQAAPAGPPGQAAPAGPPGQAAPGQPTGQRVTEFTRYPQEVKDRALQMVDEKVPYREIAAQVSPHCSTATIARWKKEREEKEQAAPALQRFEQHRLVLDTEEEIRIMRERHRALGW